MAILKKMLSFFLVFLRKTEPEQQSTTKMVERPKPQEVATMYNKISDLLNDLDRLFTEFRKLQPKKSDAAKLVKRYGPYIMDLRHKNRDDSDGFWGNKLDGFAAYGLPTFLIAFQNANAEDGTDIAQALTVATKLDSYYFRRPGCEYYEVVEIITDDFFKKPVEVCYVVEVESDGQVTALPLQRPCFHRLPNGGGYTRNDWFYPDYSHNGLTSQKDRKAALEERFCLTYSLVMRREYGVNIIIKKDGWRATFTVPQDRWKYFFKDRIDAITPSGRKRPIFHSVSAHERQTKKGTSFVKTHYRGSRHFAWNDYEIRIVMQGKHGLSQARWGLAGTRDYDSTEGMVPLSSSKWAEKINKLFEGEAA